MVCIRSGVNVAQSTRLLPCFMLLRMEGKTASDASKVDSME